MGGLTAASRKNTLSVSSKVVLVMLVMALAVALGAAVYAASDNTPEKTVRPVFSKTSFDPFTLQSTDERADRSESDMGPVILLADFTTRPAIRIPFRPPLRSPFRPPLVSP